MLSTTLIFALAVSLLPTTYAAYGNDRDTEVEYIYKYRVVNWCVTGNNEPTLFEWPFVQFKPFLLKTHRFARYNDTPDIPDPYLGKDAESQEQNKKNKPGSVPAESKAELSFNRISIDDPAYEKLWTIRSTTAIPDEQPAGYKNPNEAPAEAKAADTPAKIPFPPWEFFPIEPIGHHKFETQPKPVTAMYNDPTNPSSPYVASHLHQRIHIELKLTNKEKEWEGVEGILIQGNHAPFGMGFPFGQFFRGEDTEGDFPCQCEFSQYQVVPCLSRPDLEAVAPTIALFHHEMLEYRKVDPSKPEEYPKKLFRVGRKSEFHFNFLWHSHPCSSANLVTFTVLIVHDFYRRRYEIRTFGPYDFSPLQISAEEFETLGQAKIPRLDAREASARFNNLRWFVPLSNTDPEKPGANLWRFADSNYGGETRSGYIQNPFYMPSPIFLHTRRQVLPQPTCVLDPALPDKCQEKWTLKCHGTGPYFTTETISPAKRDAETKDKDAYKFRFNGQFDVECLTKYPLDQEAHKQCANWTGQFRCDERYEGRKYRGHLFTYKNLIDRNKELQTSRPGNRSDTYFNDTICMPCKAEVTTTPHAITTEEPTALKRTAHGMLMLFAFVYFMPLSMIIARYYKETLHLCESKGFRLWLWLHIGISILAMLLAYAGYNLPTFWELNRHMWLGYGAMFCAALGLLTGWGRHKIKAVRTLMFWLHSIPSYCAIALAACSMFWSPSVQVSFVAQWTIIGSAVLIAAVLIALDCCVYCTDRKLGMHPPRKHIPVLQVRFEDTYTKCHIGRLVFLGIYAVLLLVPVIMCFFL